MKETIQLRDKPELKVIFNTEEFEIVDVSEPKNSGIYLFGEIKSVELNKERTNWFISTLSLIVDLLTGGGNSGRFKDKANLKLKLGNQNLKILLDNANFRNAERIIELVKNKKSLCTTKQQ